MIDDPNVFEHATTPGVGKALPTVELLLSGVLVLMFPASMSTRFGSLGAYVSAAVSLLCLIGFLRVRPTLAEIRRLVPVSMIVLILAATALAAMTQQYQWAYVRGTPAQWGAFLGVVALAGLWQERGGNPRDWVRLVLWASALVSTLAIVEYVQKDYVRLDDLYSAITSIHFDDTAYRRSPDSFRSISTLGNPLALGTFTAVAAAGALSVYLDTSGLAYLLLFIANTTATFASLSRSSWLALVVGSILLGTFFVFQRGSGTLKMHLHLLAGATIAVALAIVPASQESISARAKAAFATASGRILELQDSFSYSHRTSALSDALDSMITSPHSLLTGFGLGAENSFFLGGSTTQLTGVTAKDASLIRTFDNTYVTVAYSFGSLGLFWMLRLMWIRLRGAVSISKRECWQLGMLTAAAICLYFYNALSAPSASYLAACLLGFRSLKGTRALPPCE